MNFDTSLRLTNYSNYLSSLATSGTSGKAKSNLNPNFSISPNHSTSSIDSSVSLNSKEPYNKEENNIDVTNKNNQVEESFEFNEEGSIENDADVDIDS